MTNYIFQRLGIAFVSLLFGAFDAGLIYLWYQKISMSGAIYFTGFVIAMNLYMDYVRYYKLKGTI